MTAIIGPHHFTLNSKFELRKVRYAHLSNQITIYIILMYKDMFPWKEYYKITNTVFSTKVSAPLVLHQVSATYIEIHQ